MKFLLFVLISLIVMSCHTSPNSKENYMKDFGAFIKNIEENHETYSQKDWNNKEVRFNKFTHEWRKKFDDDFTWKEEFILVKYQSKFYLLRNNKNTKELLNLLEKDVDEVKKELKHYLDNDMKEDVEFIKRQARELGKTTEKAIREILKEIEEEK